MIRNIITKDGFQGERNDGGLEMDYNDACELLASSAWKRYFVRKLVARRDALKDELAALESNDIGEFKKRQAQISLIGEIILIPEIDAKNLRSGPSTQRKP
ncbi:MAG: hypothetical protein WCK57_00690 [Verrucomicrobiae bacterium]